MKGSTMNEATQAALTATYLEFYASCPEGFESALDAELRAMGLRKTRRLKGRVTFTGTVADAYRACLWSRLASRVFVVLGRFDCWDANALYDGAYDMPTPYNLVIFIISSNKPASPCGVRSNTTIDKTVFQIYDIGMVSFGVSYSHNRVTYIAVFFRLPKQFYIGNITFRVYPTF